MRRIQSPNRKRLRRHLRLLSIRRLPVRPPSLYAASRSSAGRSSLYGSPDSSRGPSLNRNPTARAGSWCLRWPSSEDARSISRTVSRTGSATPTSCFNAGCRTLFTRASSTRGSYALTAGRRTSAGSDACWKGSTTRWRTIANSSNPSADSDYGSSSSSPSGAPVSSMVRCSVSCSACVRG